MSPENQHHIASQIVIGGGAARDRQASITSGGTSRSGRSGRFGRGWLPRWRPSTWQIVPVIILLAGVGTALAVVSFAASQYVITSPTSGATVSSDFPINTEFQAAANTPAFNVVVTLDGRTILAKVGSAANTGDKRQYVFSGGVNGANTFPVNNLSPGQHTLRAYARSGTVIGQGAVISSTDSGFTAQPKNIIVTGDAAKAFPASALPIDAAQKAARTAYVPGPSSSHQLATAAKSLANGFGDFLLPKAGATYCDSGCRHGNLQVTAPPGIAISVRPYATNIGTCQSGDDHAADGNGQYTFTGCGVSSNGGTSAKYSVTLGDTPAGYSLGDARQKDVNVQWNTTTTLGFIYGLAGSSSAGGYVPSDVIVVSPPSPPASSGAGSSSSSSSSCSSGSIILGAGASSQPICTNSGGPVVIGPGAAGVTQTSSSTITQTSTGTSTSSISSSSSSSSSSTPTYNYTPSDGPLLAVTKLTATGASMDVFGYKTVNNLPVGNIQSVAVTIDGVSRGALGNFAANPAYSGVLINFNGVNLADGHTHTLVFKATNANGASNSATITINASGAPATTTTPPPATTTTAPISPQLCDTNQNTAGVNKPTDGTAAIAVCAYDVTGGGKTLLGTVVAHAKAIGSTNECAVYNVITSGNATDGTKGRGTFTGCPVATDGSTKQYTLSYVNRPGYREADNDPHKAGCDNTKYRFTATKNAVTRIEIYLTQASGTVICDPVTTSGSTTPGSGGLLAGAAGVNGPGSNPTGTGGASAGPGGASTATNPTTQAGYTRDGIVRMARRELAAGRSEAGELSYMRSKGIPASDPWCAWFVDFIWKEAGVKDGPLTGCSGGIGAWAKSKGTWHPIRGDGAVPSYKPRKGDAVVYSTGSGSSGLVCPTSTHVGTVVKVYTNGTFDTIDGNWGDRVTLRPGLNRQAVSNGGSVLGFASPVKD